MSDDRAGARALEGAAFTAVGGVTDDVEVSRVELLVDGVVASRNLSFPTALSSILPRIADDADGVISITLRAVDTCEICLPRGGRR